MALPLEILLHVFDILAEEDKETLKQCALVCSEYSMHCQRLLFADINLLVDPENDIDWRLAEVLEDNQKLGTYVRSLCLAFQDENSSESPSVPRILARCTRVNAFTLRGHIYEATWRTIFPVATRKAIEAVFHSPLLNRLVIIGFEGIPLSATFSPRHTPLAFLKIDPNQLGLPVLVTSDYHEDLPEIGSRGPPIFVHSLAVHPPKLLSHLAMSTRGDGAAVFDFSQLSDCEVTCLVDSSFTAHINGFLRRGAPLEKLKLVHGAQGQKPFEGLFAYDTPLVCFSTLRHLRVHVSFFSYVGVDYDPPLADLLAELKTFPAYNVLEYVRFSIYFRTRSPYQTTIVHDDWFPLATSFKKETFPSLKTVDVGVEVLGASGPDRQLFRDLSFKHLDLYFDFKFTAKFSNHW